ncbi:MAG: sigma-70 family RNA polymerase sigma factor [Clostridia bacterium]|nr:sigma-70 family RNA polymerase sigma factor [Clostridia bacterium]NLS86029.1 sigma-70 family RNA polymerase sigma factor [Oscillospiraceae bacterium]
MALTVEEIYSEHRQGVYKFLYSFCRDTFLAEDLTQDVFLKVFQSISKFDGRCKLSTWIYQIAKNKNTYFDYARKNKYQISLEAAQCFFIADITEETIEAHENMILLQQKIAQLESVKAEILQLRAVVGLSYGEIADIYEKTEVWARVNFYRAKQALLERMHENEN